MHYQISNLPVSNLLISHIGNPIMALSLNTVLTLWLVLSSLVSSLHLQDNGETQILLQNVPIQDEKLLVVNVYVANITDLYGAEVQLHYDPTQLQVRDDNRRLDGVQISPGQLIAANDRFVVTNAANPQTGLINFVFTLLKPAQPISGEGVLATVVFEITGDSPFSVEVANAQLVSSNLESIPITTQDLQLNGSLQPVEAQPQTASAPTSQLWPWALAIVLLGLVGIGGTLVLLRSKPAPQPPPDSQHVPTRRMPQSPRSSIRSAALLAEQGTRSLNQGDTQRAYELFSRAIELDPANIEAWLGKGVMAQQETERRICLQRVLALDPDNSAAKQELAKL